MNLSRNRSKGELTDAADRRLAFVPTLIEFSSAWREMVDLIEHGRSVILIAPRHYGKWSALERYASTLVSEKRGLIISSRSAGSNGTFSYARLWDRLRGQLGCKRRMKGTTSTSFLDAFHSVLEEVDDDVTVFVGGAGRGHEETHYKVLATLHALLSTKRITIVGTDDYSCFFYQRRDFLLSDLHSLFQV